MALRLSNRNRNQWAVALLEVQPQDHILEIGFGPGLAIRELARRATDGFVLGIDYSAVMVRQAAARNRAAVSKVESSCDSDPPWTFVISARCSTRHWLSIISGCGPNPRRGLRIFAGRCGRAALRPVVDISDPAYSW
jgi:SAM-dependent methyltransferase